MSKYRSSQTKSRTSSITNRGNQTGSTEDVKEEKKFFTVAIIVTIAIIVLIYFLLN